MPRGAFRRPCPQLGSPKRSLPGPAARPAPTWPGHSAARSESARRSRPFARSEAPSGPLRAGARPPAPDPLGPNASSASRAAAPSGPQPASGAALGRGLKGGGAHGANTSSVRHFITVQNAFSLSPHPIWAAVSGEVGVLPHFTEKETKAHKGSSSIATPLEVSLAFPSGFSQLPGHPPGPGVPPASPAVPSGSPYPSLGCDICPAPGLSPTGTRMSPRHMGSNKFSISRPFPPDLALKGVPIW